MALNIFDTALHVGGQLTDWDSKKQQEQLEERFKELQDNKQLYRALATTRYSKDLERYYKKVEENDKIESAYAKIEKEGMNKKRAAYEIIMATPSLKDSWVSAGTGEHGDDRRQEIINSVVSNFKDKESWEKVGPAGGDKFNKWYEFSRPEMKLTAPKQEDYFQSPEYWGDLAKEIRATETGPLQKQILKMLGKEPAEVDLDSLEEKAGTDIEEMLPKAKTYKSTGVSKTGIDSDDIFDWSQFQEDNPTWLTRYNTLIDKITWNNLNNDDHFISWMTTNNLLGANTEANFKLSENDTKIEAISPEGTAMLSSYKAIYNEVVKSFDAKTLASMGIDITSLNKNLNVGEVNKVVTQIFEQRAIKETLGKGTKFSPNLQTNSDFISVLPLTIVGADGLYTVGKNGGEYEGKNYNIFADKSVAPRQGTAGVYHNWLLAEAVKIEERWNVPGKDPINKTAMAMMTIQKSIESGGPYAQKLRDFLDSEIKKKEDLKKESKNKKLKEPETILEGDLKIYDIVPAKLDDGTKGYSDGTDFVSWEQAEKDGNVERILKEHSHLQKSYDEWKATQSEDNISDTSSVNEKIKHRNINTDEKEEVITNNEETIASGVGSKPWLFSDETFNPDFDTSSIDMDKMYTVGTEANDYLKAKNLYEREQRKKNSILNKFFN